MSYTSDLDHTNTNRQVNTTHYTWATVSKFIILFNSSALMITISMGIIYKETCP